MRSLRLELDDNHFIGTIGALGKLTELTKLCVGEQGVVVIVRVRMSIH